MPHKHHSCSCKHEDVKYCRTCAVVHCLDCNQEWTAKGAYTWTPYTYGNGTGVIYKNQLGNDNSATLTWDGKTKTVGDTVELKACNHGN